jgi:hypothetical protein
VSLVAEPRGASGASKPKVVYRVTVKRGLYVHTWHFFTKRAAEGYATKHLRGFYVESHSIEESGYHVEAADAVTVEVGSVSAWVPHANGEGGESRG